MIVVIIRESPMYDLPKTTLNICGTLVKNAIIPFPNGNMLFPQSGYITKEVCDALLK